MIHIDSGWKDIKPAHIRQLRLIYIYIYIYIYILLQATYLRAAKVNHIGESYIMYLPSNCAVANGAHHDSDLHLQGHKVWNAIISKTVRARENAQLWLL